MTNKNEYPNKERAERFYQYVIGKNGESVSKRDVCDNVDGYVYREHNVDVCPAIRQDMLYINQYGEHDVLIVFEGQRYYAAMTPEQAKKFRDRKVRTLLRAAEEIRVFDRKIRQDGQCEITEGGENVRVHITFPNA